MRFAKYHGLGNDFVVIDRLSGGDPIDPGLAVRICDRRRGVGADGVLTILPSKVATARMHVTNADGSVAQMCGNGIRCVAAYLADEHGAAQADLALETGAGVRACRLARQDGEVREVTVDMGKPELEASRIPICPALPGRFVRQDVMLGELRVTATAVSMGNPHLVLLDVPAASAAELGPRLERHPLFPERTNVELVSMEGAGLAVTVWERGVGLTEACGTGACAAMVAAVLEGRLPPGDERPVRLPGGVLHVRVLADLSRVWMRGPAERSFVGEMEWAG